MSGPAGSRRRRHLPALSLTTPRSRMKGLLGRTALDPDEGLLLRPAGSVHTAFMRFPIDVVFLDGAMRVLRVEPGRAAVAHGRPARRARAVLELAAGAAERAGIAPGMRLARARGGAGMIAAAPSRADSRGGCPAPPSSATGELLRTRPSLPAALPRPWLLRSSASRHADSWPPASWARSACSR